MSGFGVDSFLADRGWARGEDLGVGGDLGAAVASLLFIAETPVLSSLQNLLDLRQTDLQLYQHDYCKILNLTLGNELRLLKTSFSL